MNTVVKMRFGSHLYGTDGPDSDADFKCIFIPKSRDILLQRAPKVYRDNKSGYAVDIESFSLHYWFKLMSEGQTVTLDMLFAPDDMIVEMSATWQTIRDNKDKLIHKATKAFLGYCRQQVSKYGTKSMRIGAIKEAIKWIREHRFYSAGKLMKVGDVYEEFPVREFWEKKSCERNRQRSIEICGRTFTENTKLAHVVECLEQIRDNYGKRAHDAENNQNIDWKAVSHAFRVAHELKELLTVGRITFPLANADFIKKIKCGEFHFKDDSIDAQIDALMKEIEEIAKKSTLREHADQNWIDDFVEKTYMEVIDKVVS